MRLGLLSVSVAKFTTEDAAEELETPCQRVHAVTIRVQDQKLAVHGSRLFISILMIKLFSLLKF